VCSACKGWDKAVAVLKVGSEFAGDYFPHLDRPAQQPIVLEHSVAARSTDGRANASVDFPSNRVEL
jgi:hypothetical protein